MALKNGFLHGDLHPGNLFINLTGLSGCMDHASEFLTSWWWWCCWIIRIAKQLITEKFAFGLSMGSFAPEC